MVSDSISVITKKEKFSVQISVRITPSSYIEANKINKSNFSTISGGMEFSRITITRWVKISDGVSPSKCLPLRQ